MNKKNTVLLILLIVIILLGILNLIWLADLREVETNIEITPLLKSSSATCAKSRVIDVMVHEDKIYPYAIEANKGDTLILSFAVTEEPMFFMLEGYEVNERINIDSIEVYLDKEGVFPYYCLSCESKEPGYLIVN